MAKTLLNRMLDSFFDEDFIGRRGEKLTERELKLVNLFGRKGKTLRNLYVPKDNGETSEIDLVYITQKGEWFTGEALLDIKDIAEVGFSTAMNGISPLALGLGFLAAFVTGCLACQWMVNLVKKGKLVWFAVYCAIIGIFAITYACLH